MPRATSCDTGETIWTGNIARDIERRAGDTRQRAQQMQGFAEMLTLMAAQMRAIEEDDAADAVVALAHDEITPRVSALEEQAEEIERYGNV